MWARAARAWGGGAHHLLGLWIGWLCPLPGSPTTGCVALCKTLNLSVPLSPPLSDKVMSVLFHGHVGDRLG